MKIKVTTMSHLFIVICILCLDSVFSADYKEGIDTTDENGNGLYSSFKISAGKLSGQVLALYCFEMHWCRGYFNYSFDDITMAPDSVIAEDATTNGYDQDLVSRCFVIKVGSTYAKVQIIKNLGGNRYVYRYFLNTQPNNKLLTKMPSDPKVRYNVSNLYFTGIPYFMNPNSGSYYTRRMSWNPPPDFLGVKPSKYIFYYTDRSVDTTKPFNPNQWKTVTIPGNSTYIGNFVEFPDWGYFNMAVLYTDGTKSNVLSGWSACTHDIINVNQTRQGNYLSVDGIQIRHSGYGYTIYNSHPGRTGTFLTAEIFNSAGKKVTTIPCVNDVFFVQKSNFLGEGNYLVKIGTRNGVFSTPLLFLK